jgi:hypothetical protein
VRIGAALKGRDAALGHQEGAARVDVVHQVVALHLRCKRRRRADGAGVVDADIDAAEALHRRIHGGLHLVLEADIADQGQCLTAHGLDFLRGRVDRAGQLRVRLRSFGGDGDIRAVGGDFLCDRQADTATGAGDE